MEKIGDTASIITLILFVLYIFGRIWNLMKDSKYPNISISVDYDNSVDDYDEFDIDLKGNEVVQMAFSENLKSIKIYQVNWNCKNDKFYKKERLAEVKYIPLWKKNIYVRLYLKEFRFI